MICHIRDCFDGHAYGYPVDAASGKKSELCFQRRNSEKTIKAYIYPDKFLQGLQEFSTMAFQRHEKTKQIFGLDLAAEYPLVATDDLWHFEYSDDWSLSIEAWHDVLDGWGLPIDDEVLTKAMEAWIVEHGKRRLANHDNVIFNLDELEQRFGREQKFRQFLRLDPS